MTENVRDDIMIDRSAAAPSFIEANIEVDGQERKHMRGGLRMKLRYKKASVDDLDILTDTRIEVLKAANKLSDDEEQRNFIHFPGSDRHGTAFI